MQHFRLIGQTTVFALTERFHAAGFVKAVKGVSLDGKRQTTARLVDVIALDNPVKLAATYNPEDCRFFHRQARLALSMARRSSRRERIIWQGRAADYRETLIDQIRRRAGWSLAERIAGARSAS